MDLNSFYHHLFGSDELSARTKAISQMCPKGYFAVNSKDAAKLGVGDQDGLQVQIAGQQLQQQVVVSDAVAEGCVLYPAGMAATLALSHESEASFTKAENWESQNSENLIHTDK